METLSETVQEELYKCGVQTGSKGGEEEDTSLASDTFLSAKEGYTSSGDEAEEIIDMLVQPESKIEENRVSEKSSDGGYASSSDEDKNEDGEVKEVIMPVILNSATNEYFEKFNFSELPEDLQTFLTGINSGLPNDYSPPIEKKPEWFDPKKYKLGQAFAQKYFVGVNISEMLSLYILFALPDGLETLIFTQKSSTPFTSFKRYLSTVLRVVSWYDYDIWDKTTLGYKNLKTVRRMHINVSKRINSIPYEELKSQVTLAGTTNNAPVWCDIKDVLRMDFQATQRGCPFQPTKVEEKTEAGKVFVNQLDMSTTQWGFMGLMVVYPEKFGAASATKDELEGFIHLWRCIGYLLGTEDKYNFCAGTLEEVIQRSRNVIDKWARPNFINVTDEWEHMARCLAEGMSYVASPDISFEVSLMYMCDVLDIPAPNLYKRFSLGQKFSFAFIKFMMTTATNYPGVMPTLNWFARKSLAKAAAMSPEELKELEEKKYEYQTIKAEKNKNKKRIGSVSKASLLGLFIVVRFLI